MGGLFPPRLPSAIGEGQPRMAEQGSRGQQIQTNVQGPMKQNASLAEQSEAPRRRCKRGQEQHPGEENQDSQHNQGCRNGRFGKRCFCNHLPKTGGFDENPWKLKPGFINRVLVAVILEASKCL